MVTQLGQRSKEKVCTVIHFLHARHVSSAEIHLQLVKVHGEEGMSWQIVVKWSSALKSGQLGTADNEKSGRLMTANTPENKACDEASIWITNEWLSELEYDLGLLHGTVAGLGRSYASTRVVRSGFHEHCQKTTRRKEWLLLFHSSNGMPFMVTIFSNTLLLDTTWFHPSLCRDKLCKHGVALLVDIF
jgi:hypothetical protein